MPISQFDYEQMQRRLSPKVQEVRTAQAVDREGGLHDEIEDYCKERGYLYRHDRMDKPTTGQVGWPDWTIFMPKQRVVFLELKSKGGKTTTAQLSSLAHARKFGFTAEVVDNFDDALRVLEITKT